MKWFKRNFHFNITIFDVVSIALFSVLLIILLCRGHLKIKSDYLQLLSNLFSFSGVFAGILVDMMQR